MQVGGPGLLNLSRNGPLTPGKCRPSLRDAYEQVTYFGGDVTLGKSSRLRHWSPEEQPVSGSGRRSRMGTRRKEFVDVNRWRGKKTVRAVCKMLQVYKNIIIIHEQLVCRSDILAFQRWRNHR